MHGFMIKPREVNQVTRPVCSGIMLLRHPIRWRDADALGHVNNAVYVTYVEELLVQSLVPILGEDFVTARLELNFRSELRYADAEIVAHAALERVGTSSVTFGFNIESGSGRVAADGRIVVVAWDSRTRGSRALTDAEKAAVEQLRV
jgi:acyl-CoA thioester hydrolase